MTRRHKKAAALAAAMKQEDETERQRLSAQRDDAFGKIDALKAMRAEQIDAIEQSAKEQVERTTKLFSELLDDEQRRIAEIDKQLRDLDGDEGVVALGADHNSFAAAQRAAGATVTALKNLGSTGAAAAVEG